MRECEKQRKKPFFVGMGHPKSLLSKKTAPGKKQKKNPKNLPRATENAGVTSPSASDTLGAVLPLLESLPLFTLQCDPQLRCVSRSTRGEGPLSARAGLVREV